VTDVPASSPSGPADAAGGSVDAASGTDDALPDTVSDPVSPGPAWFQHEPPRWLPRAVLVSGLLVFGLYSAWWVAVQLSNLLIILLSALFLGFALEPAVSWWARRGMRRGSATLLVYAVILISVSVFLYVFGALVVEQIVAISKSLPSVIENTAARLEESLGLDLKEEAAKLAGSLGSLGGTVASTALQIGATIVSALFSLFTIALFGFYIAAEGPGLRRNVCSLLPPARQHEVLRIWEIAVNKTAGYIYSRVLLATVSAVCTSAFLYIIDVPNALTLGIFVGFISQFIPTVGTYIAGALPVLVAFTISPGKALLVLIFILAYQQFENYILTPPLSSRTMQIHPAVAFGSVIAGAALLGPIGALIALPAAATIQSVIGAYIERRELVDSPLLVDEPRAATVTERTRSALGKVPGIGRKGAGTTNGDEPPAV
jgi:predicted PurR-regulated permease PerM